MKPISKKREAHSLPLWGKIACAAAFLAAVIFVLLLLPGLETIPMEIQKNEKETLLCQRRLDEIARVTITPPSGNSYVLEVSGETLVLSQDPSYPIRTSVLDLIRENICTVRAERVILSYADNGSFEPAFFGLAPAACQARIDCRDGSSHLIRIGSQLQGDEIPYYYFLWDEDPLLYAGGTDMYSAFSYEFEQLHTVAALKINPDLLDSLSITGENALEIRYTDTGWLCVSPYRYPLDETKMSGYLKNIQNLAFLNFVGRTKECTPADFGLDHPLLILSFTESESTLSVPDTAGKTHTYSLPERKGTVRFGKIADAYSRYAEYDGCVYTVSLFLSDFLFNVSSPDLLALSPFAVEVYQLASLTLQYGDRVWDYTLELMEEVQENGNLVMDENGQVLYSLTVRKNGVLLSQDSFLHWYNNTLRSLVPDGQITQLPAPGTPPTVQLVLRGQRTTRTVSFIRIDPLHYAMDVDGSSLYYISGDLLASILNAP